MGPSGLISIIKTLVGFTATTTTENIQISLTCHVTLDVVLSWSGHLAMKTTVQTQTVAEAGHSVLDSWIRRTCLCSLRLIALSDDNKLRTKCPNARAVGETRQIKFPGRRCVFNAPPEISAPLTLCEGGEGWGGGAKSRRFTRGSDKKKPQNCQLCLDADSFLAPYPSKFLCIHGST